MNGSSEGWAWGVPPASESAAPSALTQEQVDQYRPMNGPDYVRYTALCIVHRCRYGSHWPSFEAQNRETDRELARELGRASAPILILKAEPRWSAFPVTRTKQPR